jgi:hypothetical protein
MVGGIVSQTGPTIDLDRLQRTSTSAEVKQTTGAHMALVGREVTAAPEPSDAGGAPVTAALRSQPSLPKGGQPPPPAVVGQQTSAAIQNDPAVTVPWISLTLFSDPDTGTPVAIYRDKATGEIIRQVPEDLAQDVRVSPGQVRARRNAEHETAAQDVASSDKGQETVAFDVSI